MTLVLDLPADLEQALAAEAARLHLPLPEYALRVLAAGRAPGEMPQTGQELVGYWEREGLIGTRPDIADPVEHARALRREAETRKWQ